jgi:hypothetical protein
VRIHHRAKRPQVAGTVGRLVDGVPQRLELASQLHLVPLDGAQVIEGGPDAEGGA